MKKEINSNEILNERFSQIPEVIQDIILESNWKEVIRRVTKTYNLHIDQGGYLEAITLLTMLGLEEPEDYTKNIKTELKITDSLAIEISKEIETDVFKKIRSSVVKKTTEAESGGVEIMEEKEEKNDLYKMQAANVDILDQQDEERKNEAAQDLSDIAANMDLIKKQEEEKETGDETVDRNQLLNEIEGLETKKDDSSTNFDPIHMRTLKSDIVKKKLDNPSWVPKIDRKDLMSNKTKNILTDAKKTFSDKNPTTKIEDGVK